MAIVWKELSPVNNGGGNNIAFGTFEAYESDYYYKTVECGFKPKYVAVYTKNSSAYFCSIYDETLSTTRVFYASESTINDSKTMSSTSGEGCIVNVRETGFDVNKITSISSKTMYYFAIG